jgi:hypothetical protein
VPQRLFSFFLLFLFLSKLGYSLIWQVHYELNKADIIARYCENKDRPELHCNGQCYLAKQLKKADAELQSKAFQPQFVQAQKETLSKAALYSFNYISNCFHPPCIA